MARDSRIDEYLATRPADQRALLERLRARIARVAPDAEETISYGMPAFHLGGRFLVSFAAWKRHCSIYPLTDSFLATHERDLDEFARTRGSLHFTPERPLSDELLDALVRARIADLERDSDEA